MLVQLLLEPVFAAAAQRESWRSALLIFHNHRCRGV